MCYLQSQRRNTKLGDAAVQVKVSTWSFALQSMFIYFLQSAVVELYIVVCTPNDCDFLLHLWKLHIFASLCYRLCRCIPFPLILPLLSGWEGSICKFLYFHSCHGLSKFVCTKWLVLLTVLCTGWRFLWSHWNRCLYSCWICGFESIWWFASRKYPKSWLPCRGIRLILHFMLLFVSLCSY